MKLNPLDLSIIVISFNTADLTLSCLQNIYQKTLLCRFEVIVVDNASRDGSPEYIKKTFPTAILIRNSQNLGFAAANNQGIKVSKGHYIFLLNSDTIVLDGAIDCLVAYLDTHPEIGIVGPQLVDKQGKIHFSPRLFPTLSSELFQALHLHILFPRSRYFGGQLLSWWDHKSERLVDSVEGSALFIRKSVIDQVGLLDTNFFFYSEDIDLCWRVKETGSKVVYYPDAQVIHFGGGSGNRRSPKLALEDRSGKIYFFQKHYGERQAQRLIYILLLGVGVRLARLWPMSLMFKGSREQIVLDIHGLKATARYLLGELGSR